MSYEKFKTNPYGVGGTHQCATISIEGDITKTGRNLLIGRIVHCNRKNQWLLCWDTSSRRMGEFFKKSGGSSAIAGEKMATTVMKSLGRVSEIGANIGSAAVSKIPRAASSSIPDVLLFYRTGKGLYLGILVQILII